MSERVVLSVFVASVFIVQTAHAVVLCAKPRSDGTYNTSVKVRDVCKASESQLDAAQLGVQASDVPVLRDSTGVVIGPFWSSPGHLGVLMKAGSVAAEIIVDPTGAGFTPGAVDFRFESANCTGQPLTEAPAAIDPLLGPGPHQLVEGANLRSTHTAYVRPAMAAYAYLPASSMGIAGSYTFAGGEIRPIADQADCDIITVNGGEGPRFFVAPDMCCKAFAGGPSYGWFAPWSTIDLTVYTPPLYVDFNH